MSNPAKFVRSQEVRELPAVGSNIMQFDKICNEGLINCISFCISLNLPLHKASNAMRVFISTAFIFELVDVPAAIRLLNTVESLLYHFPCIRLEGASRAFKSEARSLCNVYSISDQQLLVYLLGCVVVS